MALCPLTFSGLLSTPWMGQWDFPRSYRVSTYAFSATSQTFTQRSWEALYSWCVPFRKDRPWGHMDRQGTAVRDNELAPQALRPMPPTH